MWRVTLTGVVAHRLRYALTALSVLLGVAFIAGTFVLTDTINSTFNGLYDQIYQGTGAVVRATEPFNPGTNFVSQRQPIDASLASTLVKVPGVKAVAPDTEGYAQLVGRDGKPIGSASNGPPTLGVAWTDVTALNPLRVLPGGQPPAHEHSGGDRQALRGRGALHGRRSGRRPDQAAPGYLHHHRHRHVGQRGQPARRDHHRVRPGHGGPGARHARQGQPDQRGGRRGGLASELVSRLQSAIHDPNIEVVSGQAVTAEGQDTIHQAMSFIGVFLLSFALIALFVGSFVIFNTFSIIVAQRQRELALLRAVGASRRQVMASVLGESLVIGVVASAVGPGHGDRAAVALKAGLAALGFDLRPRAWW